jgi:hypothetical protein
MASIQEIINAAQSIKSTSEQLATMTGSAAQSLQQQGGAISNIVRGSNTGMEAVQAISVASRSLMNAATSMQSLGRSCDSCINNLSK